MEDKIITDEATIIKINNIINKNKVDDLLRFINKRQNINCGNQWFGYLFYLIQTVSIFLTSLGQAYTNPLLSWTGIGLTSIGTLIHAIINSNNKINNSLMTNIKAIKSGNYIDELNIDALEEKKSIGSPNIISNFKKNTSYMNDINPSIDINDINIDVIKENKLSKLQNNLTEI